MISRPTAILSGLSLLLALALMAGCAPTAEAPAPVADAPKDVVPAAPTGTAAITGTVRYEGAVPRLQPLSMDADPGCAAKHTEPVYPEVLVLGEGNTLANVFVKVKSGLPDSQWPMPTEPVVMDQQGCRYIPRVLGVMAGQTFRVLNSDGLLHNVHAMPRVNPAFNVGMPASRTEADHVFRTPEEVFNIKCDVHPWMAAYVTVTSHPFHSSTKEDGQFRISALPAGTYEIEAWHERLGAQTASVTVADGETQSVDFTFRRE